MYETFDAKTGEVVRKDLDETQRGLESGELVSVFEAKKPAKTKAVADENKG